MLWGNESFFNGFGSNDQDIRYAPYMVKNALKFFFSGLERPKTLKLGMQH